MWQTESNSTVNLLKVIKTFTGECVMLFTFILDSIQVTVSANSYEEAKQEAEKMNKIVKV